MVWLLVERDVLSCAKAWMAAGHVSLLHLRKGFAEGPRRTMSKLVSTMRYSGMVNSTVDGGYEPPRAAADASETEL